MTVPMSKFLKIPSELVCMESVIRFMEICPFHDAHRAIFWCLGPGCKSHEEGCHIRGPQLRSRLPTSLLVSNANTELPANSHLE